MELEHKICQTCSASLEQGYCYKYQDGVVVSALCFSCNDKEVLATYRSNRILRTSLLTSHINYIYDLKGYELFYRGNVAKEAERQDNLLKLEIFLSTEKIRNRIKAFEQKVWFSGLQELTHKSRVKGVSAKTNRSDEFAVLTYTMAGRVMFTIENVAASITTLCSDSGSESTMGIQGISASEQEALDLLDKAIELFQTGQLEFKDDTEVGIF